MEFSIDKKDQYVVLTSGSGTMDAVSAAALEKQVVLLYSQEKQINYILDLEQADALSEEGIALIRKISMLCQRESGIFVTVSTNDDVLDALDQARIEGMVSLLSLEEAIDAIFMNELENEFLGDEVDEDHGFESIEGEE